MKPLLTIFLFTFLFLFTFCKKNKDKITIETINGMVYNQGTDSGLAGVTVYLKTLKDNSEYRSESVISGSNGNFSFNNVEIHSDTKYSYAIYIPSKSGTAATTPEYCGFNGTTMSFSKDDVSTFLQPKVTPKFLFLNVSHIYSGGVNNLNDSVQTIFSQAIFHKNIPILPYSFGGSTYGVTSPQNYSIGNYPVGLYKITIDKWKSGVHTTTIDSIYLNWTATKSYTVNW